MHGGDRCGVAVTGDAESGAACIGKARNYFIVFGGEVPCKAWFGGGWQSCEMPCRAWSYIGAARTGADRQGHARQAMAIPVLARHGGSGHNRSSVVNRTTFCRNTQNIELTLRI